MAYDRRYFWKKAFALYPGVVRPICAPALAAHYRGRRAERGWPRALLDAVVGLGFHAWLPLRARQVARRFGLGREWRRTALTIARARFADPNDLALFRIRAADELDGYIRRFEDAAINKRINPNGWRRNCALADKRRFAERCAAAGLPHAATVATGGPDGIAVREPPAGRALVVKPARGEGGGGVEMLPAGTDEHGLRALLHHRRREALVVQPRVATHADLRDLALAALPTVRIVTMLDEAGAPEVVSATFRCPSDPAACVDNMKAGGLIAPVAIDTGTLGVACLGYGGGDYPCHPVTGAAITGRVLPDWEEASALVQHAHARAFGDYALIGWDVALAPEGPLLIEGNGKPGVLMPQRAARAGLAQARYGELLAHHLATRA